MSNSTCSWSTWSESNIFQCKLNVQQKPSSVSMYSKTIHTFLKLFHRKLKLISAWSIYNSWEEKHWLASSSKKSTWSWIIISSCMLQTLDNTDDRCVTQKFLTSRNYEKNIHWNYWVDQKRLLMQAAGSNFSHCESLSMVERHPV